MSERPTILVVDDQADNRLLLEVLLSDCGQVRVFCGGGEVLAYLSAQGAADLVLLDVMMPEMDGYEVCRRLKAHPAWQDIPVIFLTGLEGHEDEEHGLSLGAADFVHKPFSPAVVSARVRIHLSLRQANMQLRRQNGELERLVAERTHEILVKSDELLRQKQEVIQAHSATITAFRALAETRDNETGAHIRRTQNYVKALAERVRDHPRFVGHLDDMTIQLLFESAPLHDIGKVAIPDAILLKPGKLTPEEWVIMQRHCEYGRDALLVAEGSLGSSAGFLHLAREIAYGHHERWDGAGYPLGLSGEEIPLSARLMAVADVYDALISRRVYKPPMAHEEAVGIIVEGKGKHFDPDLVDAMLSIEGVFRTIASHHSDQW